MDDWYNDTLPRYPRVLIQREQESLPPQPPHGGNAIRIRVQGRRSGNRELETPRVTIHRYQNSTGASEPNVTVETRGSKATNGIPIQIRHITGSPITGIARAQQRSNSMSYGQEPMKATPLTSLAYDINANAFDIGDQFRASGLNKFRLTPSPSRLTPSPSSLSPASDNIFPSFEQEFDRFTSEYTSLANRNNYLRSKSMRGEEQKKYASRRHESEDITAARRQQRATSSSHSSERSTLNRGVRELSPNLFLSTYSGAKSPPASASATIRQSNRLEEKRSTRTSPTNKQSNSTGSQARSEESSSNQQSTSENVETASVVRAKWVLDKVLGDLVSKDRLKGRRNSIVTEAKDCIKRFSDELDISKMSADDTDSGYSGSGDTTKDGFSFSTIEIKEKIRKFNSSHTDSKLTEVSGDGESTFQGDVQICMCLEHPVRMLLSTKPASLFHSFNKNREDEERITASATIPNETITKLHISSRDTTDVVIRQLLNKFNIVESAESYGLYEQTLSKDSDKQVKLRKAALSEKPLVNYLQWNTESQGRKRFILKESYNADIMWDSFSIPELSNFVLMLEMEHKHEMESIRNKYNAYRRNVLSRMKEIKAV